MINAMPGRAGPSIILTGIGDPLLTVNKAENIILHHRIFSE